MSRRTGWVVLRLVAFRNGDTMCSNAGGSREADVSLSDLAALPGLNSYYGRVPREKEQAAWSSPIWISVEDGR
jgi:hypothetical protein